MDASLVSSAAGVMVEGKVLGMSSTAQ